MVKRSMHYQTSSISVLNLEHLCIFQIEKLKSLRIPNWLQVTLLVIKLQDKAEFKSYIMHNHGQHFDIEPKEVSPANKYKTMDGLCHLQRACYNSIGGHLSGWTTRACIWLHLVSSKQSAFSNITEKLEGRGTNTCFHLTGGEVDLEEYEFPLVDSGLGLSLL